jgi:choline dehydrogenase-like flavoprotein
MANEKVDAVIVGAGASGSVFAAVLAKAGKKVVILEQGPDWQLADLISSDFWGRRIKPASGPFLLEGKNPFGYVFQAGWGVGGAALHYFANFPRLLPNDFKIKSERPRARLADLLRRRRVLLRQSRAGHWRVGRRQGGGNLAAGRGALSHAADEDLPARRNLAQGLRGSRHPHGAGSGCHHLDRLQGSAGLHS